MARRVFFGLALALVVVACGIGFVRTAIKNPIVFGVVAAIVAVGFAAARVAASRGRAPFAAGGNFEVAKRVARGDGLPLDALATRLGKSVDELRAFAPSYREARIPKRRGGERRLLIPDDATKALQRKLLREVLFGLRAHPAATGFERGKSVVDNALPHVGSAVVIRMDVVDFFPSTKTERVLRYFQWIGWNREAAEVLTKLTTWDGGLPQGAPTSPRLSNLVNVYLDVQIAEFVERRGGSYTRYADDITISLPRPHGRRVRGVIQHARRMLKHHGYALHVKRKLHVARRHQRQIVTGLVVNDGVRLPREIRRRLRATAHRIEKGGEPLQGIDAAQGWFAYARMVERQAREKAPPPGGAA